MKVYCVFQRFREDNEFGDGYEFDDEKGADLFKVFDDKQKADLYIEELFTDWRMEHEDLGTIEVEREIWEGDFNTFIREIEVE